MPEGASHPADQLASEAATPRARACLLPQSAPLGRVAEAFRANPEMGAALLVDADGRFQGLVPDAPPLHRAAEAMGDRPALEWAQPDTPTGQANWPAERNQDQFGETDRFLPILDEAGRPVDLWERRDLGRTPLVVPSLDGNEAAYLQECVTTRWISSQGAYIPRFERGFADFLGAADAVAVANGTVALHLALRGLGVGAGDEVIVPDLTFGATANAVIHAGATPVFVDVDPSTWTMTAEAVRAAMGPATKALIPVHLYGHPCDMAPLTELAEANGLWVIEDCAESLGARYRGQPVGVQGHAACFSFFGNKILTTGEGGMVITREGRAADRIRLLRDHGMDPANRYWHLEPGFNARMTNMQAAIGCAQLERIDTLLANRRRIAEAYNEGLAGIDGLAPPPRADWAEPVPWLHTVRVHPEPLGLARNTLARRLDQAGVETRPCFHPLHPQPAFATYAGEASFPVAEQAADTGLSLPTGNHMGPETASHISTLIRDILGIRRTARP